MKDAHVDYPCTGNPLHRKWGPSDDFTCPELSVSLCEIGRTEETDVDWFKGRCIESAHVRALVDTANKERPRRGELDITDRTEVLRTLEMFADHGYSIQEGSYTLLHAGFSGNRSRLTTCWVVGQQRQDGKFQKLTRISMGEKSAFYDLEEPHRLDVLKNNVRIILC